ncbi:MAG: bifunctional protein-serine/threonine kinase/phosphatase [Oleiphilaceae bacterium]|nr:bifunctional protein-serine/threonine kinase/phosphatase [Oleiphilaceae bacterium]
MASQLEIAVGQCTDRGRKDINQDFHGVFTPREPQLSSKGVAIALADGISSSDVSQVASESAVKGFLQDYFSTSEAWSVKKSAHRVLMATNSWLYAQTRQSQYRYDKDRGYVCTFSAMVIKSTTAHIFHAGDARIYRRQGAALEQLTQDHRLWVSRDINYLSRALGVDAQVEIDYQALGVGKGDVFVLATDGVYEYASAGFMINAIDQHPEDLDAAAKAIVSEAYERGSADNLTCQIIRIENLPSQGISELHQQINDLPFPPMLEARMAFDGFRIVRPLHASSRSHVYLGVDKDTDESVILKTPSTDLQYDPAGLERFLMEEWVARRVNSAHVVKPCSQTRKRNFLYIVTEFIDGQTLTQWMIDNPRPDLETVRGIIEQVARGLRALHRLEMLHQDLRPANIMIDSTGTAKIIDFGSTRVAGIMDITRPIEQSDLLGTALYTAPEYFLGESGSPRSDIFALGVMAYQMLSGKLPYGVEVAKTRTRADQRKLRYDSLVHIDREIPAWVDDAISTAVHPSPDKRYGELSEFVFDLRHPNKAFLDRTRLPLIERNPLVFWKGMSLVLAIIVVFLALPRPLI